MNSTIYPQISIFQTRSEHSNSYHQLVSISRVIIWNITLRWWNSLKQFMKNKKKTISRVIPIPWHSNSFWIGTHLEWAPMQFYNTYPHKDFNEVMRRNHLCFWMQFSDTLPHKDCQWSYAQNHLCFWMQFSNTLPHKDCQWSYASKPSVFECKSVTHCHTKIVNEVKHQNHLCKIVSDI